MVSTPEERMAHWKRCIRDRPKWPFHTPTRCTNRRSIDALHDHLADVHGIPAWRLTGWYPPINTWENLLRRHETAHEKDGWETHIHTHLPDVSQP